MPRSLTVIIPTYNRPAEARDAVTSACAETPSEAEILVIDDGSSPPVEHAWNDPRVRVIRHPENLGPAAARNSGLQAAEGEWVAFLDSDDVWPSGSFATRWAAARDHEGSPLTVFVSGFRLTDPRSGRSRTRHPAPSFDPVWFASGCWFCPGSTALFRRQPIFDVVGLQDTNLPRLEDLDWFLRLALAGGGVEVSPVIGAEVRRSTRPSLTRVLASRNRLLNKYTTAVGVMPSLRARLNAYLELECAAAAWAEGRPVATTAHLARSWFAAPRHRLHLERFWKE